MGARGVIVYPTSTANGFRTYARGTNAFLFIFPIFFSLPRERGEERGTGRPTSFGFRPVYYVLPCEANQPANPVSQRGAARNARKTEKSITETRKEFLLMNRERERERRARFSGT